MMGAMRLEDLLDPDVKPLVWDGATSVPETSIVSLVILLGSSWLVDSCVVPSSLYKFH